MKVQDQPDLKIPDLASKFLYSALGGLLISVLKFFLKRVLLESALPNIDFFTNILLILLLGILFLRKEHLRFITRVKRWKAWRVINSFILLIGFFAPWLTACNPAAVEEVGAQVVRSPVTWNGLEVIYLYGILAIFAIDESILSFIVVIIVLLGLIFTIVYLFQNLRKVLLPVKDNRGRIASLAIGFVGMIVGIFMIEEEIQEYLWGYWLTWIGLLSCLAIELLAHRNRAYDT